MAPFDIKSLSVHERLRLLDEIWESLADTPEAQVLDEELRRELDQRNADLDRDIQTGVRPLGVPFGEMVGDIRRRAK
jgi:putative addiction module component (TIGR02574 family)